MGDAALHNWFATMGIFCTLIGAVGWLTICAVWTYWKKKSVWVKAGVSLMVVSGISLGVNLIVAQAAGGMRWENGIDIVVLLALGLLLILFGPDWEKKKTRQ